MLRAAHAAKPFPSELVSMHDDVTCSVTWPMSPSNALSRQLNPTSITSTVRSSKQLARDWHDWHAIGTRLTERYSAGNEQTGTLHTARVNVTLLAVSAVISRAAHVALCTRILRPFDTS